tara:strand:+ start:81103 stop:82245 length:1143 start_codon:yes stop_codon:yes gene_type:complete
MENMKKKYYVLWLDGIFNHSTLINNKSISPASNYWKTNLILNLKKLGVKNIIFSCPIERVWPLGKLIVHKKKYKSIPIIKSYFFSYLNIPYLREIFKYFILKKNFEKYIIKKTKLPKFIITWSVQDPSKKEKAEIKLARYLNKKYKINWLCLIGEGITPPGATHYMYSCWYSYLSNKKVNKYYLDGGVKDLLIKKKDSVSKLQTDKKIFIYIGDLGIHGGALELAKAFNNINNQDVELIICGKGENKYIEKLAASNPRIKILGFLKEKKLAKIASNSYAFVNPRPLNFEPNLLNFPSKLLYYFSFEKPVLSTLSPGMSPEITKAVIPIYNTDKKGILDSINYLLLKNETEYANLCKIVKKFKKKKTWISEVSNFKNWFEN